MGEQTSVIANVDDQAFVEKVEKGLEPIGRGDFLYVDPEMRQTLSDGKLHVLYAIKKVRDHKRSADKLPIPRRLTFTILRLSLPCSMSRTRKSKSTPMQATPAQPKKHSSEASVQFPYFARRHTETRL